MIINVRGQAGSGKSTTVKRFTDTLTQTHVLPGDKQVPLATEYAHVAVLGNYKSYPQQSGCDQFDSNNMLIALANGYAQQGYHVIYESMMFSNTTQPQLYWKSKNMRPCVLWLDIDPAVVAQQRQIRSVQNTGITNNLKTTNGILDRPALQRHYNRLIKEHITAHQLKNTHTTAVDQAIALLHTYTQQANSNYTQLTAQQRWDLTQRTLTTTTEKVSKLQQDWIKNNKWFEL